MIEKTAACIRNAPLNKFHTISNDNGRTRRSSTSGSYNSTLSRQSGALGRLLPYNGYRCQLRPPRSGPLAPAPVRRHTESNWAAYSDYSNGFETPHVTFGTANAYPAISRCPRQMVGRSIVPSRQVSRVARRRSGSGMSRRASRPPASAPAASYCLTTHHSPNVGRISLGRSPPLR